MDILNSALSRIVPASAEARDLATRHISQLTMPPWALGRVLDLAVDLAGMTCDQSLPVARKEIILMAGDHGIAVQGVCPQKSEVTGQMMHNFASGGAGINVLSRLAHAHVTLVDIGVASDLSALVESGLVLNRRIASGTNDFTQGPAMSREQAVRSLETGIAIVEHLAPHVDVFGTGDMGIGNTSPSSAIVTVLSHASDPAPFVGPGAGLASGRLAHKIAMIRAGIELNRPDPADPVDVLAKVGGYEIGGIAGVILGAASCRKPVVVDGFISTAGALIAAALCPDSRDYMILAHGSAEPGHVKMASLLGKKPLLDLGLRLGEGTGGALAMPLLDAASAIMNQMATFASAGVHI